METIPSPYPNFHRRHQNPYKIKSQREKKKMGVVLFVKWKHTYIHLYVYVLYSVQSVLLTNGKDKSM